MSEKGAESTTTRLHPRRRWGRRLAGVSVLLGGVLVALHYGLGRAAETKLNQQVAAYRAAGEPMTPAELARFDADDVADAENAAVALRAAAAGVDEKTEAWRAFEQLEKQSYDQVQRVRPPLTDEEVKGLRAVVAANGPALAQVSQALSKPGINWKLQFTTPVIMTNLPDLTPQRRLARLLGVAVLVAHHDGDDAQALRRVREMLRVSRAIDRQPTLISHMVSLGISALAAEHASQVAPELRLSSQARAGDTRAATPQQVRELIDELLDDRPVHEGRRRALRGERASQLDAITALAYGTMPLDRIGFPAARGNPERGRRAQAIGGYVVKPMALNDGLILIRYTTGLIEAGDADNFPALRERFPRYPMQVERNPTWHRFAAILMPSYYRVIEQDFRNLAARHMAAVALAARWYALEHEGKLPQRLEDLVPKYLPKVPVDPLAAGGKPLGYVGGERPRVYSVGENGRDDGGYEPPPTASNQEVRETSDQVVHLKRHPRPPKPKEPEAPGGFPEPPVAPDLP